MLLFFTFLTDDGPGTIFLDKIVSIQPEQDPGCVRVRLVDGTSVGLEPETSAELLAMLSHLDAYSQLVADQNTLPSLGMGVDIPGHMQ